ncbi:hypothetical protein GIB67_012184 [Kingdonia uniflora]|uniref:Uncharacterized protein n=1 Tax=Kingdonia uniflora TaxID=39325 RepID=A0A7J7NNP3_9MAGN|nr:hypothetical protein GIB67_012184 [Kingdonia uniflora]
MTSNIPFILDAMCSSSTVEVQGDTVQRRGDWSNWLSFARQSSSNSQARFRLMRIQGACLEGLYNLNRELGLAAETPVGTSLIDAHAGGVGVIENMPVSDSSQKEDDKEDICHRMVLVCEMSTCHMAVLQNKVFILGVWEPFWTECVIPIVGSE